MRRIVITAGHGEFLGECGRYSRCHKAREPIVVEVPWFKVKDLKKTSYTSKILAKLGLAVVNAEKWKVKHKIRGLTELGEL